MALDDPLHLKCPAFLDFLEDATSAKLKEAGSLVSYSNGQLIHSRGANKPGISIVESGTVFAGITDADGKQLIVGILGKGQCFGEFTLFTDLVRTHDVSAVGETRIYQIPATAFSKLFDNNPDIARALLQSTLYRLHILLESMDAMRRLPVLERTAKILLIFSYTSGKELDIPVRQEELANTVGVSRVTMGKALKELAKLQLISLGYGLIHINNKSELINWLKIRSTGTVLPD
jgi:CRP-like cAMP-binding protein